MKNLIIGVSAGLAMLLAAGTAGAYGQFQVRQYECNGYESRFSGTVEILPDGLRGTWQVDGRQISVTRDTLIKERLGKAAVGAYVQIEGTCSDKALEASRIFVRSID